jgi:hypothetical protein
MHKLAEQWDIEHGFVPSKAIVGPPTPPGRPVPENRPCDWCGEMVEKGYVHDECSKKEAEFWLDILY